MHLFSRQFQVGRRTIVHTSSGSGGSPGSDSVGGGKIGTWITTSTHEPQSEVVSTPNLPKDKVAVTFGGGGGKASRVSSGKFKGRVLGGGSRANIHGTSVYGSGYPSRSSESVGVAGQPFPYFFHPIVWAMPTSTTYPSYLNATAEYGLPSDTSRPGGALMQATLHSNSTGSVFHFIADNSTTQAVLPILRANCGLNIDASSVVPFAYTGTNASDPSPVDAVQYFRASSAVLTLEGYNNTAAISSTPNLSAFLPLPTDTDTTLSCLNTTIGASIPLVDAPPKFHWGSLGIFLLVLAGCVGLALIVVLACCCFCASHRRKRRRQDVLEAKAVGAGIIHTSAGGNGRGYEPHPLTKEHAA
ncbi:hypothetical protein PENSPDRAFT_48543 [Peniophora sp. CONT]|nr:hypothetical protein PENSPDRAFT_48543 [Peniophora sp. CONT]